MTRNEVIVLCDSIGIIADIQDRKLAFVVSKNMQKLGFAKKQIQKDVVKMIGDQKPDEWLKTPEAIKYSNEEYPIKLHKIKELPNAEYSANQLNVLNMILDVKLRDDPEKPTEDGKPDGPKLPPKK